MVLWCCKRQTALAFHLEEWDSFPLCSTNVFKSLDLKSWALQIASKWHSVVFTFAVKAFSCSEILSFQIIFELSDDFIEFMSLGKWFWKLPSVTWLEIVTESNGQNNPKEGSILKDHAFEVKFAKIWNWNTCYLLKIHSYTRGTTKNRAKSVFLI